jgi:hypothetical protein
VTAAEAGDLEIPVAVVSLCHSDACDPRAIRLRNGTARDHHSTDHRQPRQHRLRDFTISSDSGEFVTCFGSNAADLTEGRDYDRYPRARLP